MAAEVEAPDRYPEIVKPNLRFALLAVGVLSMIGCSAEKAPVPAPGALSPGQEASARTMGIATPNGVANNPTAYTGDINYARSGVEAEQKRAEAESAAVKAMSGGPH